MVVALAGAVGANHWRGRNEDFPFRIAGRERALEPLALFGAPERFFGTIGGFIVRAVVAAFEEPELHILADAVRAVVRRRLITGGVDGHLLAEEAHAYRGQRRLVAGLVRIVETEVVVIFDPIGGRVAKKLNHARESKLLVPFLAHRGERLCWGLQREAVVNDIPRSNEEVGFEFLHRCEGGIAELLVFFARRHWSSSIRDAGGECKVVHAASNREGNAPSFGIEGLEGTRGTLPAILKNQAAEVARARLQIGQPGADDEIRLGLCLDALSELGLGEIPILAPFEAGFSRDTGDVSRRIEIWFRNGSEAGLEKGAMRRHLANHLPLGVEGFWRGGHDRDGGGEADRLGDIAFEENAHRALRIA